MGLEIFASLKVYQLILATGIFPFGSCSSLQDTLLVCQVSTVSLTLYASISSSQLQKIKTLVFERVENIFPQEIIVTVFIQVLTKISATLAVWMGGRWTQMHTC